MHETTGPVHYPHRDQYVTAALRHPPPAPAPPPRSAPGEGPLRDRVRRRAAPLLPLLLVLPAATPVSGQEPADGTTNAIRAFAELGVAGTRLHGEATPLFELAAGLTLGPRVSVGGAARIIPAPVEAGSVFLQDVDLELGYGGAFLHLRRPAWSDRTAWFGRLLLGAGNADVRDRATSLRLDSDNFLVVEPSVGIDVGLVGRLRASAAFAYRFVSGVEDLRGVGASDLRSASLALHLTISPL